MKEALYYKKLKNRIVLCQLCPKFCTLKPTQIGDCKARKNINGKLKSLVYGNPISIAIDPIEKKPLFHFLPGTRALSIGTTGCNLHCKFCQNWGTSQSNIEDCGSKTISPKEVIKESIKNNCKIIAYTYNEPTIFYEYVLEIAKLAKKAGIKNIIVSNGYINQEPLKEWCKYLDAANIDLKSFTEKFYKELTTAKLKPVLETIKTLYQQGVWLEITNLLIPKYNDKQKEIGEMCKWISKNTTKNTPIHFSRFFPYYKLLNMPPTPLKTLVKAQKIAQKYLNHVYIGNVQTIKGENTYCQNCNKLLIERKGYSIIQNNIREGKCNCNKIIKGVWK
ncbi:AmmeMemoRadiSam system radical SAM enzyme [Candidatus Woesearchaeota archaeon]|nr:AmmeMemoRadiSam system radical SAM enzyme [Candidatus Woesearchaeota archaeon]MBL7050849.1 AmmeMemoRadiSam system radical SAM enzyme [Candidatus Woesearchaeota archaeon]